MANNLLRNPYQLANPQAYEDLPDLPVEGTDYLLHDADTLVRPLAPHVRFQGFNAPEVYNRHGTPAPVDDTPRQVGGREAAVAGQKYLNEHGLHLTDAGVDKYGRKVSYDPGYADYMVRNNLADPMTGFSGENPELAKRMRDAQGEASLRVINNPDKNMRLRSIDDTWGPAPRPMGLMQSLANGLSRGTDVLQGDLYGAGHVLARAVDSVPGLTGKNEKTLAFTQAGMDRNAEEAAAIPARYNSYHDIKGVGDVLPYAAEKVAESLPSMAPMIVGGLLAPEIAGVGILGRAALSVSEKALAKKAAFAGSTVLGALPHAGEIEQEQAKLKTPISPLAVGAGSLVNSALDTVGLERALGTFTHAVAPVGSTLAAKALDISKQLAKSVGITTATEGVTESLQEITNIGLHAAADPTYNPLEKGSAAHTDAMSRIKESFVGGAAAGGLMGGMARGAGIALAKPSEQGPGDSQETGTTENPDTTGAVDPLSTPGDGLDTLRNLAQSANMWDSLKGSTKQTKPGLAAGLRQAREMGFTPSKDSNTELLAHLGGLVQEHGADAVHDILDKNEIVIPKNVRAMFDAQAPRTVVAPEEKSTRSNPEMPPENQQEGTVEAPLITPTIDPTAGKTPEQNNVNDITSAVFTPSTEALQPETKETTDGLQTEISPEETPNAQEKRVLEPTSASSEADIHHKTKLSDSELEDLRPKVPHVTIEHLPEEHHAAVDEALSRNQTALGSSLSSHRSVVQSSDGSLATHAVLPDGTHVISLRNDIHSDPETRSAVLAHEDGHTLDSDSGYAHSATPEWQPGGIVGRELQAFLNSPKSKGVSASVGTLLKHALAPKPKNKFGRELFADIIALHIHAPEVLSNEHFRDTRQILAHIIDPGTDQAADSGVDSGATASAEGLDQQGVNRVQPNESGEHLPGVSGEAEEDLFPQDRELGTPPEDPRGFDPGDLEVDQDLKDIYNATQTQEHQGSRTNEEGEVENVDTNGVGAEHIGHTYFPTGIGAQHTVTSLLSDKTKNPATDQFKQKHSVIGKEKPQYQKDAEEGRGVTHNPQPSQIARLIEKTREIFDKGEVDIHELENGDRVAVPKGYSLEEVLDSGSYFALEHVAGLPPAGPKRGPKTNKSGKAKAIAGQLVHKWILRKTTNSIGPVDYQTRVDTLLNRARNPSIRDSNTRIQAQNIDGTLVDYDGQGVTALGRFIDGQANPREDNVTAAKALDYFHAGLAEIISQGNGKVAIHSVPGDTIIYRAGKGREITLAEATKRPELAHSKVLLDEYGNFIDETVDTPRSLQELDKYSKHGDRINWSDEEKERSRADFDPEDFETTSGGIDTEGRFDPNHTNDETLAKLARSGTAASSSNVVLSTEYHADKRVVGWLQNLAKLVGIKAQFYVMDEAGLEKYRQELTNKSEHKNAGVWDKNQAKKKLAILDSVEFGTGKFVSMDTSTDREQRVPILFISSQPDTAEQLKIAAHEFGHLVQRTAVDQLIAKAGVKATEDPILNEKGKPVAKPEATLSIEEARQVVEELFGKINWLDSTAVIEAEEMFAENIRHWATTSVAPKTALEKFFHHVVQILEIVRNWYNKQAPSVQYSNVAAFMDAMVQSTGVTHSEQGPASTAARNSVLSAQRDALVTELQKLLASERTPEVRRALAPLLQDLKHTALTMRRPTQIELSKGKQYEDVVASLNRAGFLEQRSEIADQNWGAEELYQGTKALYNTTASKVSNGRYSKDTVKTLGNLWEGVQQVSPTLISLDSELRSMGSLAADMLANAFRFQPGKSQVVGKTTIHADLQILRGEIYPELAGVLAALPKPPSIFSEGLNFGKAKANQKAEIAAYKRIAQEANKNLPLNQIADLELRARVEALRIFQTKMIDKFNQQFGMNIKERLNYYTGVIDHDKWQAGESEIQQILIDKGFTAQEAKEIWDAVLFSDGVLVPLDLGVAGTVYAPNLSARNPRFFEPDVHTALAAYYSDDIHGTLLNYTRSLINRAVMQKHFGGYAIDVNSLSFIKGKDNRFIYDPMGRLNFVLDKSKLLYSAKHGNQGGLTPAQYLRIKQDIIPALMGTKGAQAITPTTRAVMSWTKTYFNVSLLGLCTLSSINDLGGMHMKVLQHKDVLPKFALVKAMLRQASKEGNDMNLYARMLGTVDDNYIESVMAGDEHNGFMVPGAQRVNSAFFRAIGMKWWTDTTRSTALILARDTLSELGTKASRGDAKARAELSQYGLSPQHVLDWIQSETVGNTRTIDTAGTKTLDLIKAALNTYVDQAVLRPTASSRPVIGSDQRMQLIWYLNDFMYSFYETTMRVTMASMAQNKGLERVVPLIMLGAVMLPLAAVGYELRKLIARDLPSAALGLPDNTKDPETVGAYTWEMMQRSGMLGPAQKLVDYEETDARGKLAIISLLGPIVESMVTMLDKGFPYFISHTAPVLGQSRVLRDSWGRGLEKALDVGEPNNQKKAE